MINRDTGHEDTGTYCVYVQHGDVRWRQQEVLNERGDHVPWLELHEDGTVSSPDGTSAHRTGKGHTKMSEAKMYNPSVATIDMTMFRKIAFANNDVGLSGSCECTILSTPLNARKNAAN